MSEQIQASIREAARHIAAVSSPDCRCIFTKGHLVAMCSLCEIGAERIEEAMVAAVESAVRADREALSEALKALVAVDHAGKQMLGDCICVVHEHAKRAIAKAEGRG